MFGICSWSIILSNDPHTGSMKITFIKSTTQTNPTEAAETNLGSVMVTLTRLQLPWYFLYGNW